MSMAMTAVLLAALAASAPIETLKWMEGRWTGSQGGTEMEEIWTAPRGGTLLGMHRDVEGGRTVGFEFLRIEQTEGGLVYLSQPQGRPATPFPLKESGPDRVVFENPAHDFPQRILYWRAADGALHARIEGTENGKAASMEWRWVRED